MRTRRQIKIAVACAKELVDCGSSYLLPDDAMREGIAMRVIPRPTTAEVDEVIKHLDSERRILGIPAEDGTRWKLTDVGRAWLQENS
jgi:hypothetical protein